MKTPLAAAAAALVLSACGGSGDVATVDVEHVAFAPSLLEVTAGTEVTWTNLDEDVTHTATSGVPGDAGVPGLDDATAARPDGTFDGSMEGTGATFSFTFEEPGRYAYFCRVHQSMTGEIVVR